MVRVDIGLKTLKSMLGQSICTENADGDNVCIHVNARQRGDVYVKITVNNRKVAYGVFSYRDLVKLIMPAIFAATASPEDVEELWDAVKKYAKKAEERESKTYRKRKRVKGEEEEEREEGEEEEELELL